MIKYPFHELIFSLDCACCGANLGGTFDVEIPCFHSVYCRQCVRLLGHCFIGDLADLFDDKDNKWLQNLIREAGDILNQSNIGDNEDWWNAPDKNFIDTPGEIGYDITTD